MWVANKTFYADGFRIKKGTKIFNVGTFETEGGYVPLSTSQGRVLFWCDEYLRDGDLYLYDLLTKEQDEEEIL